MPRATAWLCLCCVLTTRRSFGAPPCAAVEEDSGCGVCHGIALEGHACSRYGACDCMGPDKVQGPSDCVALGFCQAVDVRPTARESFGLRVSLGHGTRPYGHVRISAVSESTGSLDNGTRFFDYSARFRYKWTQFYIHSAVKAIEPGRATKFAIGSHTISVSIPRRGQGVAGVLIADPCFRDASITSLFGCHYNEQFQLPVRTPALLNAFVASPDVDFWGILGDNFYDRAGHASTTFFSKLTQAVKEKPLVTVPGNHDYWVLGSPEYSSALDQCGNGHMQFYAMDSEAASRVPIGNQAAPFNYSVDPDAGRLLGCNLASADNARFFQQIGNVGIVGQSGAFAYSTYEDFVSRACLWLSSTPGIEVGLLLGHWDNTLLGVQKDMDMPHFFDRVSRVPGCDKLASAGNLKFVMGHTHCNVPNAHGHVNTGFMVAGQGMEGCGNYGVPIIDTTDERTRMLYFDTSTEAKYKAVMKCVPTKGWRACQQLADVWLDQRRKTASYDYAYV